MFTGICVKETMPVGLAIHLDWGQSAAQIGQRSVQDARQSWPWCFASLPPALYSCLTCCHTAVWLEWLHSHWHTALDLLGVMEGIIVSVIIYLPKTCLKNKLFCLAKKFSLCRGDIKHVPREWWAAKVLNWLLTTTPPKKKKPTKPKTQTQTNPTPTT